MNPIEAFLAEVERRYRNDADPHNLADALAELRSHLSDAADELTAAGHPEPERESIKRLGTGWKADPRVNSLKGSRPTLAFWAPIALLGAMLAYYAWGTPVYPTQFDMNVMNAFYMSTVGAFVAASCWIGRRVTIKHFVYALLGSMVAVLAFWGASTSLGIGMEPYYGSVIQFQRTVTADRAFMAKSRADIYSAQLLLADIRSGKVNLAPDRRGWLVVPSLEGYAPFDLERPYGFGTDRMRSSLVSEAGYETAVCPHWKESALANLERTATEGPKTIDKLERAYKVKVVDAYWRAFSNRWSASFTNLSTLFWNGLFMAGLQTVLMLFGWLVLGARDRRQRLLQ